MVETSYKNIIGQIFLLNKNDINFERKQKDHMNDKKIEKFLNDEVNNFYHLNDRYEEVASKIQFSERNSSLLHFKKGPFFAIVSTLSVAVIVLSSFIGYQICQINANDYNNSTLYAECINNSKDFLTENLDDHSEYPFLTYSPNKDSLLCIYSGIKENNKKYIYQILKKKRIYLTVDFICNSYTKTINLDNNETSPIIGFLNDDNFVINDNDIVYGNIYKDNSFLKKITINF